MHARGGWRHIGIFVPALVGLAACTNPTGSQQLPAVVDFDAHIQPILSNNCYVCHGPDISTREAGLRLDLRDSAIVALEGGGAAIVPGDPGKSLVVDRIASVDPEERMPPPEIKKTLSPYEIGLIERWIEQGAEYRPHWALVPPERTEPPPSRRLIGDANPVDRYLTARLREEGLRQAQPASKEQLLRRASFVLTGLPPSPEGVAAFLADDRPDAYERVVDRLIASPHFGERWARHWMDVVRYADTKGHEFDYPVIGAWQYRDYLIRAFNNDLPYDRLVTEHLAGDLLPDPRRHPEEGIDESALGTMFYTLGEGTHSPVDLQVDEAGRIDNIIDVTGKAFLGLTVACARCHDHKFDPIPTADYYSLYGVVKSTRFAVRDGGVAPDRVAEALELEELNDALRAALADAWTAQLGAELPAKLPALTVERPVPFDAPNTRVIGDFRMGGDMDGWEADGLAFGESARRGDPLVRHGAVTALATPRVSSAGISRRLYGTLRSPTFDIDTDSITVRAAGRAARVRLVIDNFQLIQYPIYGGLEQAVDTPDMRTYTFDVARWRGRPAYIELFPGYFRQQTPVIEDSAYVELAYAVAHDDALPAAFVQERISPEFAADRVADAVRAWRGGAASYQQVALLNEALAQGVLHRTAPATEAILDARRAREALLPAPQLYIGVLDGQGRDHPVFVRGNVAMPTADSVARGFLTALSDGQPAFDTEGSGRMAFAHAVTAPDNPLTARVMVNRIWHHVFGRGIVETVDNFGLLGKRPSHPALLDYLARRFVEEGWSVKAMIRLMVTSEAFRAGTSPTERGLAHDPENVLLHYYPVRRLEAEAIRDAMLAASGRLDYGLYGPPVPVHLSDFMTGRGRPAASGPLDGDGRRSLYLAVRRNFLNPFMLVFDMPIPFSTFGQRNASNVPAQSLALLNDPFVAQQAAVWAERVVAMKELDAAGRIAHMYFAAFGRSPRPHEVDAGLVFLAQQAAQYGIGADPSNSDPYSITAYENDVRVWRDYAHTLFNMKEFIHLI